MVSKTCPITGKHVGIIYVTQWVTTATLWPAKNTLNFSFKRLYFKNGTVKFSPSYIFENLRWRWTPCTIFFFSFAKSCILSCLSKFYNVSCACRVYFLLLWYVCVKARCIPCSNCITGAFVVSVKLTKSVISLRYDSCYCSLLRNDGGTVFL